MEGKGSFFNIVLLFILAFLSLTLAALAGYVFLVKGNSAPATKTIMVTPAPVVHADSEFKEYELITEKAMFNLKNADLNTDPNATAPIIQTTVYLKCIIKLPKAYSVADPALKLDAYKTEIRSLVGTYFLTLTKEQALNPAEYKEIASTVLCKQINDLINANEKEKPVVVYNVIFADWSVF